MIEKCVKNSGQSKLEKRTLVSQWLTVSICSVHFSFHRYGKLVIPRERRIHSAISPGLLTPARRDSGLIDVTDSDQPDEEVKSLLAVVKAVENKVDVVVDYLVDNGADINAQDKYGMTPMHHTAIRGNRKALQRLLITPGMGS